MKHLIIASLLITASSSAFAVDGVILIDQAKALAGNVTPGDAPGFPVTLSKPGSYKLSSNLIVPSNVTTGILSTPSNVQLDLNGFSVIGPGTCSKVSNTVTCLNMYFQNGIDINQDSIVMNGTVAGFGNYGLAASINSKVVNIKAAHNGAGIYATGLVEVRESTAYLNQTDGIVAGVISDCGAYNNGGSGLNSSLIVENSKSINNVGYGISGNPVTKDSYAKSNLGSNCGVINTVNSIGNICF